MQDAVVEFGGAEPDVTSRLGALEQQQGEILKLLKNLSTAPPAPTPTAHRAAPSTSAPRGASSACVAASTCAATATNFDLTHVCGSLLTEAAAESVASAQQEAALDAEAPSGSGGGRRRVSCMPSGAARR